MSQHKKKGAPLADNYDKFPDGLKPRQIDLSKDTDKWLLWGAGNEGRDLKNYSQQVLINQAKKNKRLYEKEKKSKK